MMSWTIGHVILLSGSLLWEFSEQDAWKERKGKTPFRRSEGLAWMDRIPRIFRNERLKVCTYRKILRGMGNVFPTNRQLRSVWLTVCPDGSGRLVMFSTISYLCPVVVCLSVHQMLRGVLVSQCFGQVSFVEPRPYLRLLVAL